MTQIAGGVTPPIPVSDLLDRTIRILAKPDASAAGEMQRVLADCSLAQAPESAEELSRALTQKAVLEKVLEQTGKNLRVLCGEEEDFRYGRGKGGRRA